MPFAGGFILPVGVMLAHALEAPQGWLAPGLGQALVNTLVVGGLAALATVGAALFMVYALRLSQSPVLRVLMPLTLLGYAAPGAVLALGLLVPLAALDHRLADARAGPDRLGPRADDHRHGLCPGAGLCRALLRDRPGRGRGGLWPGLALAADGRAVAWSQRGRGAWARSTCP